MSDNLPQVNSFPTDQKQIPIDLLIDYSQKGLSYSDIGKLAGCTKANVSYRFKAVGYVPEHLRAYKDNRADVFAHIQRKLLLSLDDDSIQKMAPRDKVLASGILYDKERTERGLANNIIGHEGSDAGLAQKLQGLLERASKIGIKITEIVGEIPHDVRDQLALDTCQAHEGQE